MIFVDNKSALWYYRKKAAEPCYCEYVVYPNDIILQSVLSTGYMTGFSVQVLVYSPDGTTQLEDATSYFSFYVALNTNGQRFFNLRCEEFSPQMCANKCYILRVIVSAGGGDIFDKFTEQYCQATCCDIPRGISIAPEGESPVIETETEPIPFGNCNVPLIRIRSIFECVDNETGLYYGVSSQVLTGSATFSYQKVLNFAGVLRRSPREINRITSFNCQLQRSESFRPYELKGNSIDAFLPDWKLDELENMLHASYIEVNDFGQFGAKEYQYAGGVIGERVYGCWNLFRINITLQDCTTRTDFGCGECDVVTAKEFIIPGNATGDAFYTENRQLIGDYADLKKYFEDLGFTVTDTSGDYGYTLSFTIQGSGVVPTFYFDNIFPRNRVYGTNNPVTPVIACAAFELGIITSVDVSCNAFELGIIYGEDDTVTETDVNSFGNWSATGTVELTSTTGRINLTTVNPAITTGVMFVAEPIGIIDLPGRPSTAQAIDLEDGTQITIDTEGIIRWYGLATSYDGTGSTITITDRYYAL